METTDSIRPDGLTVEETHWHEGWRRLVDRYGRNVPHPARIFGDPLDRVGCFAVIAGCVCSVTLVCDENGDPQTFDANLQGDLRRHSLADVMGTWQIPRS